MKSYSVQFSAYLFCKVEQNKHFIWEVLHSKYQLAQLKSKLIVRKWTYPHLLYRVETKLRNGIWKLFRVCSSSIWIKPTLYFCYQKPATVKKTTQVRSSVEKQCPPREVKIRQKKTNPGFNTLFDSSM